MTLFRSVTSEEEHVVLQSDLDMLADWSETWQLKFNASKCKVLHIGQHDTNYEYYLGNSKLENTTMEKDLGVIMDEELKFHNHVAQAAKKASGVLATIGNTRVSVAYYSFYDNIQLYEMNENNEMKVTAMEYNLWSYQ